MTNTERIHAGAKLPGQRERLEVVDALRGFALMAIVLLHNLEHYNLIYTPENLPSWLSSLDNGVTKAVFFLFAGKAYSTFCLLFGFSFYIQMSNAEYKGKDFRWRFVWRMAILVLFSQLHAFFYNGDILLLYAVVGMFLPLVWKLGDKTLVILATVFFLQPVEIGRMAYALFTPGYVSEIGSLYAQYGNEAYTHVAEGGFLEMAKSNMCEGQLYSNLWQVSAGRPFMVAGLFICGLLLGRNGMFVKSGRSVSFWKKVLYVSVPTTAILYGMHYINDISAEKLHAAMTAIASVPEMSGTLDALISKDTMLGSSDLLIYSLTSLFFMGIWVSSIVLLWFRYRKKSHTAPIAALYGRMSLTNYIGQSVIGGAVYFGYGLGMYKTTGATQCLLIAAAILCIQFAFSKWWLSRHRQGPLEYVWKKLTFLGSRSR